MCNLGLNPEVAHHLVVSETNLNSLRKFDPNGSEGYRAEFERIQNTKTVYDNLPFVKNKLLQSLILYWVIGLSIVLFLVLVSVQLLSNNIAKGYDRLFQDLLKAKERLANLKSIGQWQLIARKLAHEIKNPLTPIEVGMSGLPAQLKKQQPQEFESHLTEVTFGVVLSCK